MRSEMRIEIFEVVAVPRHERAKHVAAERELAELRRGTVGDDVAGLHLIADAHERALRDAGVLVRALELQQVVDIDAGRFRRRIFRRANDDAHTVDLVDDAGAASDDRDAQIPRHGLFHAGADQRRVGLDQRHRLALHVRAHQRAVGVVILEERNECRRDRNELLRRNIEEVDVLRACHDEIAAFAAIGQVRLDAVMRIDLDIGLGDDVAALFHRGEIDHLFGHLAVADAPIRALDEAVLIDARISREAVDQADVRAFRRLDRTDAAVMRRMHVAHLEAGTLARQTARAKRRETALMRDLGERVGLIHELRELRRAEELAHRGSRGLRVDQIVRHHRVDLDRTHTLADRALHAQEADAILILHQLADRADTAIAEMIDVVDLAAAVFQFDEHAQDGDDVVLAEHPHRILGLEAEARIHLHAADGREIVALRIEEQAFEERFRRLEGRRLARAHHAIDIDERLFAARILVDLQRVAQIRPDRHVIDRDHRQFEDVRLLDRLDQLLGHFVAGFGIDLAGILVDDIDRQVLTDDVLAADADFLQTLIVEFLREPRRQLGAGFDLDLAGLRIDEIVGGLEAAIARRIERHLPAVLVEAESDRRVERAQNLFLRHALRLMRLQCLRGRSALGAQLLSLGAVERIEQRRHR